MGNSMEDLNIPNYIHTLYLFTKAADGESVGHGRPLWNGRYSGLFRHLWETYSFNRKQIGMIIVENLFLNLYQEKKKNL